MKMRLPQEMGEDASQGAPSAQAMDPATMLCLDCRLRQRSRVEAPAATLHAKPCPRRKTSIMPSRSVSDGTPWQHLFVDKPKQGLPWSGLASPMRAFESSKRTNCSGPHALA